MAPFERAAKGRFYLNDNTAGILFKDADKEVTDKLAKVRSTLYSTVNSTVAKYCSVAFI